MKTFRIFHWSMLVIGFLCDLLLFIHGASFYELLLATIYSFAGVFFGVTQRAVDSESVRKMWRELEDLENSNDQS